MKQIIIGDIHGRSIWKTIVSRNEDADRFIFVGDYLDSFDIPAGKQLENLQDIIQFKKISSKEFILLIGNHDHHYWPGVGDSGTSGYQPRMSASFEQVFHENSKLFKMCFVDEYKTVYSHAGFSNKFMQSVGAVGTDKFDFINELFFTRPKTFSFYEGDFNGHGEHPLQSCIWIRPKTLYSNQINNLQVVGHTEVDKINHPAKSERRGFYLIDALKHKEYLSCTNGVFTIERLAK